MCDFPSMLMQTETKYDIFEIAICYLNTPFVSRVVVFLKNSCRLWIVV